MTRPRFTPRQLEVITDRRDRVAATFAQHCGRTMVVLERAYRASYAGSVLVVTSTNVQTKALAYRMVDMFPDAKVLEGYAGRFTVRFPTHMRKDDRIIFDTYNHLFKQREFYIGRRLQEVILFDPSVAIKENPDAPINRKGFDPFLDHREILDIIYWFAEVRTKNISVIGKPIPRDPLFRYFDLAPQRWSLHRPIGMLECWWAAPQYANLKAEMWASDDLDKVQKIAAELDGDWKVR